jgi:beta-lactamase regulating signal transducer with metallopeptidase domain
MSLLIEDDTLVHAIATTLLHTLWQGVLIAGVLAVLLRAMRNAPANVRYLVSCGAMMILVASALATFAVLAQPAQTEFVPTPHVTRSLNEALTTLLLDEPVPFSMSRPEFDPFRYLVTAWLVGVSILALWHAGGWIIVLRLRRGRTLDALQPLVERLSLRMSVRRAVRVIESVAAEVPAVIGVLRPVIVVPVAMLSELSPLHVEAILAHELAHVRRHDYLINLLQCAAETLLFYHPATWWISSRIRCERENCADDLAASVCGDRRGYAAALAALEAARPISHPWHLAPAATHGDLLDRVRRVLRLPPAPRRVRPVRSLVTAAVALTCILVPLGYAAQDKPATAAVIATPATTTSSATRPADLRITTEPSAPGKQFLEIVIARSGLHHANKFIGIDDLKSRVAALPEADRRRTVLVVKADTPDVTVDHYFRHLGDLHRLVAEQKLAYLSQAGIVEPARPTATEKAAAAKSLEASRQAARDRLEQARARFGESDPRTRDAALLLEQVERRINFDREFNDQLSTTRPTRVDSPATAPASAGKPDPQLLMLLDQQFQMQLTLEQVGAAAGADQPVVKNIRQQLARMAERIAQRRAEIRADDASRPPGAPAADDITSAAALIEQLARLDAAGHAARNRLTQLRGRLGSNHPDVKQTVAVLESIESKADQARDGLAIREAKTVSPDDPTLREYLRTLGDMEFNLRRLAGNVGSKSRIYLDAEQDIALQRRRIAEYMESGRRANGNPVAATSPATASATSR